jgi:hypothetical protein
VQGPGLCLVDVVAEVSAAGDVHDLHDIGVDDVDCRHTVARRNAVQTRFRVLRTKVQARASASATCSTSPTAGVTEPPRTTTNETMTETRRLWRQEPDWRPIDRLLCELAWSATVVEWAEPSRRSTSRRPRTWCVTQHCASRNLGDWSGWPRAAPIRPRFGRLYGWVRWIDSPVPKPSSNYEHCAATATSRHTGPGTSTENDTASTNPATSTAPFPEPPAVPPEEPHPHHSAGVRNVSPDSLSAIHPSMTVHTTVAVLPPKFSVAKRRAPSTW